MSRFYITMVLGVFALASTAAKAAESYEFEDVVYLSCQEAWEQSGESTENAIAMISVLAKFSMESRGLTVPEDSEDLSDEFGELIKAHCIVNPDSLLFNAVDISIRKLL